MLETLKGGPIRIGSEFVLRKNPIRIIDSSIEFDRIDIDDTKLPWEIKQLSQEKLKILFEHGVDYDIFRKDGSFNDSRLERMFKDFE